MKLKSGRFSKAKITSAVGILVSFADLFGMTIPPEVYTGVISAAAYFLRSGMDVDTE